MKKLLVFASALLLLTACQKKQYYSASTEIDLVKKGNDAYFKGDWATLRSVYADDAKIYDNVWDSTKALTPDQLIENFKTSLANFSEYKMGESPVYEMVITDSGDKWVHCWFEWSAKSKIGKEARTLVNVSYMIRDNKVAMQVNIYNALPGYFANQPSDSTMVSP